MRHLVDEETLSVLKAQNKVLTKTKAKALIEKRDANGKTELHKAAEKGDLAVIVSIIQLGGNINVQDNDGDTPLHLALLEVFFFVKCNNDLGERRNCCCTS